MRGLWDVWVGESRAVEVPEKLRVQWKIREGGIDVGWLEVETSFMVVRPDLNLRGRQRLVKPMGGSGHCGWANSMRTDCSSNVRGLT